MFHFVAQTYLSRKCPQDMLVSLLRIKTSISDRLQGIIGDKFTWDKPHLGPLFDNVPSVTISEVTNILRTMPSKSSPL